MCRNRPIMPALPRAIDMLMKLRPGSSSGLDESRPCVCRTRERASSEPSGEGRRSRPAPQPAPATWHDAINQTRIQRRIGRRDDIAGATQNATAQGSSAHRWKTSADLEFAKGQQRAREGDAADDRAQVCREGQQG